MKLVFANNFYYLRGGSERVFFEEMDLLQAEGHQVASFSRQYERNMPSEYSNFFPSPIEYESVSLAGKAFASFKLIYSMESRKNFRKLLESFRPQMIHAHMIYGRLTTSILDAASKNGVPAVMTLHDYKLVCPSYLMLNDGKVCEKCLGGNYMNCVASKCHKGLLSASLVYTTETYFNKIFRKYDHISHFICPSAFSMNKHAEAGLPREKLVHVPNFIRTEAYEPNYEPGGYILFVGRLSKEKGVLTLLNSVKGLDLTLRLVGEGPMKAYFEKYAHDNGISNVAFEGYRSGKDLRDLYRNSSFLVIPSEWYENAPMTVLEAFAYGKPVVGANIGGIPEMVIEGKTGRLFESGDAGDLREKIADLVSVPSRVKEMGMKAREMVENRHNGAQHYKNLMKVYEDALKG